MVVNHNLSAMNASRMLGMTNNAQAKNSERLSSGYRINRAADDAAGLSISEKMRSQIRGLTQASRNAQDGISMVQTAEGALTETHSMLQRIHELTVQATSGQLNADDQAAAQAEADELITEISRISNTEFNGKKLLDGNLDINIQVGINAADQIGIKVDTAMDATGLGIDSLDITATGSLKTVQDAIKTVSTTRSNLGATQNRLEHTVDNLNNVVENTTSAESRIRDTDIAAEMVEYSKNSILAQAGQAMLAQANQSNQGVLALLQ